MSDHGPTSYGHLPFAPENIYCTDDGRFVWFDGEEEHDVTTLKVWWRCPHGLEWQETLASRMSRDGGAPCCASEGGN